MTLFPENAIYIVGNAKTQQSNPITHHFGQFFIAFVVDRESAKILACGVSATLSVTNEFVSHLFVGRTLRDDPELIRQLLESRYFGSSQKAILIGEKGSRIRAIGQSARIELTKLLERPVHLFLNVKEREGWDEERARIRAIGLDDAG